VTPTDSGVRLEWGRVLGVQGYTLYRRQADGNGTEGGAWTPVYEGLATEYVDDTVAPPPTNGLPPASHPERSDSEDTDAPVYEYAVTATDPTGEGERSRVVDTAFGWHTWDPMPGERFRRRVPYSTGGVDLDPYPE